MPPTPEPPNGNRALVTLTAAARDDLAGLAHPTRPWLTPKLGPDGRQLIDVLIVGGGQSGIIVGAALRREGVERVIVVDRAAAGLEGPWASFARMPELRTPKALVGSDLGIPSLSTRRWFEAVHGSGSWDHIERIPTCDWRAYLEWFRTVTGVIVRSETAVLAIRPGDDGVVAVELERDGTPTTRFARSVVLATGFDGAGAWRVPSFVAERLDRRRYDHSNTPIDFGALGGKRIGILGHGASAFDNATAAIEAGARSVDICFRRERLPRTNPHRHLETAGLMTHYPELSEATRWRIAQFFRANDQPPPEPSFRRALELDDVTLRPATPWLDVREAGGEILVTTPDGSLSFDHLILATGAVIDLPSRPELSDLAPLVRRWRSVVDIGPDDHDPGLGALPTLDAGYGFEPIDPADDWVRRVFAFNALSYVSHGPHSTSISGHRHALPRLVRGVTRRLFLDEADDVLPELQRFRSPDLPIPDDFEEQCRLEALGRWAQEHESQPHEPAEEIVVP